ncbi:MAG: YggS family pyridoxal phosphate-dependent enzyme [Bacteroidales bacterium]|nr:YggS family pyridoxal phosphate-dependent enzyme [Bacteroidales bacterium]
MIKIGENLNAIKLTIPEHVQLVAVSKTKPVEYIQAAYDAGQRVFGENKAQEMNAKHSQLPSDIQWHFIGHLQTNKVKYIAPFASLIHGVESLKLLKEINKQGAKNERIIDCLLQFYIAEEETKFGLDYEEASELLCSEAFVQMKNIRIVGVMGMATYTEDQDQIKHEFSKLKSIADQLKVEFFASSDDFKEVSMGMSGDYELAIEQGSTMVRIGSAIFGERNYL